MTASPTIEDWKGPRGRQWAENLSGMEGMLAPIDAPLIEALRLDGPVSVLEVGCGGGRTGQAIGAALPEGGKVHGVDVSADLIDRAHMFDTDDDVNYAVLDAATETPEAAPFDRLASRFGVMFFASPQAAFSHLRSLLKSDGRFAFAVWAAPDDNPWMKKVRDTVGEVVDLPTPDEDSPGPFRYAEPGKLEDILGRAGFAGIEATDWRGQLSIGGGLDAEGAADFALSSMGDLMERLETEGHDTKARGWSRLVSMYGDHLKDGHVVMDARVRILSGTAA